jgi:hypothetical protein
MRSRIAGMCGAIFGACATMVESTLTIDQPASRTRRVGVGKVPADVAQAGRTEQRIGDRMQQRVGVGMAVEPEMEGQRHATQYERTACDQGVHVPTFADAQRCHVAILAASTRSARAKSSGQVSLKLSASPATSLGA